MAVESTRADDAAQAHVGIVVQPSQTIEHHHTVLTGERHNIGCNAHGHQVKHGVEVVHLPQTIALGESLHELEAHATSRQSLEGISVVDQLGIQNRCRVRQLIVRNMVITHDELDALFLGIRNLVDCLDAAIEHDNQFHPNRSRIIDTLQRDTITVVITRRDIVFQIGVNVLKILIH